MLFLQQMMDYVGANGQKYSEIRLIDMNIDSKPTTKAIYIPTALFLHRLQSVLAVDDLLRSGVAGAPSGLADRHGLLPLFAELLCGDIELAAGKVADGEALLDAPLSAGDGDREGEHDSLGGPVRTVREDPHRYVSESELEIKHF